MLGVEAGVDGEQLIEAANQQTGTDEQHEAKGGFTDDERAVQTMLAAAGGVGARGVAQGESGVEPGAAPCREYTEEQASQQ